MNIDKNPGQDKHIVSCLMLLELHLARCRMQDKNGIRALFLVCKNVRGLFIEDCWGLDDSIFATAVVCSIRHRIVGLRWLGVDGTCELMDDRRFFVKVVLWFLLFVCLIIRFVTKKMVKKKVMLPVDEVDLTAAKY